MTKEEVASAEKLIAQMEPNDTQKKQQDLVPIEKLLQKDQTKKL